ncbi:MAG: hypothetical protein DI635_03165, partial [Pseudoxanthomonas suwonensis]
EYRFDADGGNWSGDGKPGADGEIADIGFATAQLTSMEQFYAMLKQGKTWDIASGQWVANASVQQFANGMADGSASLTATGYSLGAHLATSFSLMHQSELAHTYTFNAAGVGGIQTSSPAEDFAYRPPTGEDIRQIVQFYNDMRAWDGTYEGLPVGGFIDMRALHAKTEYEWQLFLQNNEFPLSDDVQLMLKLRAAASFPRAPQNGNPADLYQSEYHKVVQNLIDLRTVGTGPYAGQMGTPTAYDMVENFLENGMHPDAFMSHRGEVPGWDQHITQTFGRGAFFDMEFVANSGWHAKPALDLGIATEDLPLSRWLGFLEMFADARGVLGDFGETHSITPSMDALTVIDVLQTLQPDFAIADFKSLLAVMSNRVDTVQTKVPSNAANFLMSLLASGVIPGPLKDLIPLAATLMQKDNLYDADALENLVNALGRIFATDYEPMAGNYADPEGFSDIVAREKLHQSVQKIQNGMTSVAGNVQLVMLAGLSAEQIATRAENDIAYRYALQNGLPFVLTGTGMDAIYAQHNAGGQLDAERYTHEYLVDRAGFLLWKIAYDSGSEDSDDGAWRKMASMPVLDAAKAALVAASLADKQYDSEWDSDDVQGDWRYHAIGASLYDADSNGAKDDVEFLIDGADERWWQWGEQHDHKIMFGDGGDNRLNGGSHSDRLYGGDGNDTFAGGAGDDRYEGGQGVDVYFAGDGVKTIYDSDGEGRIEWYKGGGGSFVPLGSNSAGVAAADWLQTGANTYADRKNNVYYQWNRQDGKSVLTIYSPTINGGKGTLRIENFKNGDLGIALSDQAPDQIDQVPVTKTAAPEGSFIYQGADNLVNYHAKGLAGRDYLHGAYGADPQSPVFEQTGTILEAGGGEDLVDAAWADGAHVDLGDGDDVAGGVGENSRIFGGAGNDILLPSMIVGVDIEALWHTNLSAYYRQNYRQLQGTMGEKPLFWLDAQNRFSLNYGAPHMVLETPNGTVDLSRDPRSFDYAYASGVFADGGEGNDAIEGTKANDVLMGGDGDDVLVGASGDDWLSGGDGNNVMAAGAGHDVITSDAGADLLFGESGNDTVEAGAGDDMIYGDYDSPRHDAGFGDDVINSGAGNDKAIGGGGNDRIDGGAGDDVLLGDGESAFYDPSAGNDVLTGGEGRDYLDGGQGDDLLRGGKHGDVLNGGFGRDALHGEEGSDLLYGEDGDDLLYGGAGDDWLDGGDGDDILQGGAGSDWLDGGSYDSDTYILEPGFGHDVMVMSGTDRILLKGNNSDYGLSIEWGDLVIHGKDGSRAQAKGFFDSKYSKVIMPDGVELTVAALKQQLSVPEGDDVLKGSQGQDVLNGGSGNDLLNGDDVRSARSDVLIGGSGDDVYIVDSREGCFTYESSKDLDQVIEAADEGNDTVIALNYSYRLQANVENLQIAHYVDQLFWSNWGAPDWHPPAYRIMQGNGLDNRIEVLPAVSRYNVDISKRTHAGHYYVLDGGVGADWLSGSEASEIYVVDNLGDVVNEPEYAKSFDQVFSSISYSIENNPLLEAIVLRGSDAINAVGNAGANVLEGSTNSAANLLRGGAGDDTYVIGTNDVVHEDFNSGNDTVVIDAEPDTKKWAEVSHKWFSVDDYENVENLKVGNFEVYRSDYTKQDLYYNGGFGANISGNAENNVLEGNGYSNHIRAGAGDDVLIGGELNANSVFRAGDDVLEGESGDDILRAGTAGASLTGGVGNDRIETSSGHDEIFFNLGDGKDALVVGKRNVGFRTSSPDLSAIYQLGDVVYFGSGIEAGKTHFSREGSDLIVGFDASAADALRIKDYWILENDAERLSGAVGKFMFADGAVRHGDLAQLAVPSNAPPMPNDQYEFELIGNARVNVDLQQFFVTDDPLQIAVLGELPTLLTYDPATSSLGGLAPDGGGEFYLSLQAVDGWGQRATQYLNVKLVDGTPDNSQLAGTDALDLLRGGNGDDVLKSFGFGDRLDSAEGNDTYNVFDESVKLQELSVHGGGSINRTRPLLQRWHDIGLSDLPTGGRFGGGFKPPRPGCATPEHHEAHWPTDPGHVHKPYDPIDVVWAPVLDEVTMPPAVAAVMRHWPTLDAAGGWPYQQAVERWPRPVPHAAALSGDRGRSPEPAGMAAELQHLVQVMAGADSAAASVETGLASPATAPDLISRQFHLGHGGMLTPAALA